MLFDRLYKPTNDELMYHYCGADAFAQIIRTRTTWHTAFTALNDATERKWGFEQFRNAADELRKVCGSDFIDRITKIVRLTQDHSVAMISSYSLNGDLLSQWRAYADDGRGFAIGFSSQELEMPAKPLRVLYDRAAQKKEVANAIKHGFEVEKRTGFNYDLNYLRYWFDLGMDLCAYKHPAFAEEKEIRRVHISLLALSEIVKEMIPLGAIDSAGVRRSGPVPINYRTRNSVQIPYVSLDITDGGKNSPIKEIVLGPKSPDDQANVETFLTGAGWKGVKVRRSDVPYV
jgi:Protein of unknown function (DUF2971)